MPSSPKSFPKPPCWVTILSSESQQSPDYAVWLRCYIILQSSINSSKSPPPPPPRLLPSFLLLFLSSACFSDFTGVSGGQSNVDRLNLMGYLNLNLLTEVPIRCSGFQQQRLNFIHSPRTKVTDTNANRKS